MIVRFVNDVEIVLQLRIRLHRKHNRISAAKEKFALIDHCAPVPGNGQRRFVVADRTSAKRRRRVRVVEGKSGRQFDCNLIFLRPGVIEIDGILTPATGKQRATAMLEEFRLQEKALACALGITGNADVISVNIWLKWISDVFDLYR